MTSVPSRTARQRLSAVVISCRRSVFRWGRAWRYATGRWTRTDLFTILSDVEHASGIYALDSIDTKDVLAEAGERWLPHPSLAALCHAAADRVAWKWLRSGDAAARDWALDLVAEWAARDGIVLVERGMDPSR